MRSPSSSYKGTRIEPYDGRTSGKPAAAKASARSSFQRWLALARRKPRLFRVSCDGGCRPLSAFAALAKSDLAWSGRARTLPLRGVNEVLQRLDCAQGPPDGLDHRA